MTVRGIHAISHCTVLECVKLCNEHSTCISVGGYVVVCVNVFQF